MARYMMEWVLDYSRTPEDPKARKEQWLLLTGMVKKQMAGGDIVDWGAYAGEDGGYCIVEGDSAKVHQLGLIYVPYAKFNVHLIISADENEKIISSTL